ncbi:MULTISPECIES: RidA family protein [unclassified Acidisoma]|jgi:enamine deaminase RidA (YjgF/YER057c/UK114 family)|uniref:RidA family protein n=1 Tax=unclassified Acidisoma TaxID=2634065 RepID=UPI00131CA2DB|nr:MULTISPECIES: RidA family protein [unclassified Acidisoma]
MTMATIESRLAELGITLPEPPAPVATYVPFTIHQGVVTISGQLPLRDGALLATGKLGAEVSVEAGKAAARACFINLLAQLRAACDGDLGRVRRVLRLGGFIASTPDFTQQAAVMNGASDLAVEIFGDIGRHARSTIGVAVLPLDAAVEVEGLFAIG